MDKKNLKFIGIVITSVLIFCYLIVKSSPKINKESELRTIQPVSLVDKERDFSIYFVGANLDTNKVAKFFSLPKENIIKTTEKFKKDIPENCIAIPLKEE